jgi:hypothetical protein
MHIDRLLTPVLEQNSQSEIVSSVQHTIYLSIYLSIYPLLYSSCGPLPLFSFLIYTQQVGLLGCGIGSSQGYYLHTVQHKHRINAQRHPSLK